MSQKSHVDLDKLNRVPSNHPFEYKDVVSDDLPMHDHTIDGRRFKEEVENGVYENVIIDKQTENRVLYKKL